MMLFIPSGLRVGILLVLAWGLSACKIVMELPSDRPGLIATQSGNYFCLRDQDGILDDEESCVVDVIDIHFDETFVAQAADGYVFEGWKKDDRHLCGGSRKPCRLFTSPFAGNPTLLAFLEDEEQEFFLEPVFTRGEEALAGTYAGVWTNVTFGSSGAINLTIEDKGDDSFEITLDADGNVFGQGDPQPQTIAAQLQTDGSILSTGQIDVVGNPAPYVLSLGRDKTLALSIPALPIDGFRSLEVIGLLNGGTGYLEYRITFTAGDEALGTITLYKSEDS